MLLDTGLRYDEDARTIYVESEGDCLELYTEASRSEFELVVEIAEFETDASALLDRMLDIMTNQHALVQQREYFDRLDALQRKTGTFYRRCGELQQECNSADSDIIEGQINRLYKIEKLLKHYFRCLAVAQSLGFSQRLITQYLATDDHVYLYGFVRNACSTIEFLGTVLENRIGNGDLQRDDHGQTFKDVYEALKAQDLVEVLGAEQNIQVPPTGETIRMGDITLSTQSMEFLRTKRNEIVHHCPLVIGEEDTEHLPQEILSTSFITGSDIQKLVHLSYRLHIHSVGIFMNFSKSYTIDILEQMIQAWHAGGDPKPVESEGL